jgi:hypothetical protein
MLVFRTPARWRISLQSDRRKQRQTAHPESASFAPEKYLHYKAEIRIDLLT